MLNGAEIGTWIACPSPEMAAMMAGWRSFQFFVLDMEHGAIGRTDVPRLRAAIRARRGGIPTRIYARVPGLDAKLIAWLLDQAVDGIICANVDGPQEAGGLVEACTHTESRGGGRAFGERGIGYCYANAWGRYLSEVREHSNAHTRIVAMVESGKGIGNAEGIAAVPGLDTLLVGAYDLSASLGIPGDVENVRVKEAQRIVVDACAKHGKTAGLHVVEPDLGGLCDAYDRGFRFLPYGLDMVFLRRGIRAAFPQE